MSLPLDLLALAERIAVLERTRPKQATLRRSVSTAYYALFHLLTSEAVSLIAPNLTPASGRLLQRWFDHADMKRVAGMFSAELAPKQIATILQASPSSDLRTVARSFVGLQDARHRADYDLTSPWSRLDAQDYAAVARSAFEAWSLIRRSHEANVFALALLSSKLFEKER